MSRNILRDAGPLSGFLEKLKTSHEVQDELPHNRFAKSQLEKRRAEASEEGLKEGYAQGHAIGVERGKVEGIEEAKRQFQQAHQEEFRLFTEELDRIRQETEQKAKDWFAMAEEKLAILSTEIARQAINQELKINPETILEIAKSVLAEATEGTEFRIRVNTADSTILNSRKQELQELFSHVRNLEIITDQTIKSGCILETGSTSLDAQIDTYLNRLRESIQGEAA